MVGEPWLLHAKQDGYTMVPERAIKSLEDIVDMIKTENIIGDIIECGVWKGGICIHLAKLFPNRDIWICDSFQGCPYSKDRQYDYKKEIHKGGVYAVKEEAVKNNFRKFGVDPDQDRLHFCAGWFKNTLPTLPVKQIALLRIDCDLYSSYLEVLNNLYDKVVPGGFIIFDDYCFGQIAKDVLPYFFKTRGINPVIYKPDHTILEDDVRLSTLKYCDYLHLIGSYIRIGSKFQKGDI